MVLKENTEPADDGTDNCDSTLDGNHYICRTQSILNEPNHFTAVQTHALLCIAGCNSQCCCHRRDAIHISRPVIKGLGTAPLNIHSCRNFESI